MTESISPIHDGNREAASQFDCAPILLIGFNRQDFMAKVIGEFAFANQQERPRYIDVYKRGLLEVMRLLEGHSII